MKILILEGSNNKADGFNADYDFIIKPISKTLFMVIKDREASGYGYRAINTQELLNRLSGLVGDIGEANQKENAFNTLPDDYETGDY